LNIDWCTFNSPFVTASPLLNKTPLNLKKKEAKPKKQKKTNPKNMREL
jgi:hypothetical protein